MRTHVISSRLIVLSLTLLLLLAACGQDTSQGTKTTTPTTATPTVTLDAYGTPIAIPKTAPQRIVSLAPSTSETLAALDLQSKIVGVDFYTNYPTSLSAVKRVSDAQGKFNVEQIVALKPDLVLSDGGLTRQYDTQLQKLGLNVVNLPQTDFEKTLQKIELVGRLTYTTEKAQALVKDLRKQVEDVKTAVKGTESPSVLLEVDNSTPGKPYVFGGGTFGDELLQYANGTNIFHKNEGFPQVSDEAVIAANPHYIILTEDPLYGGKPELVYKRSNWSQIAAVKSRHVYHLNPDIMQRPSPRLVQGLRCVAQILHPDKFTGALPDYCSAGA